MRTCHSCTLVQKQHSPSLAPLLVTTVSESDGIRLNSPGMPGSTFEAPYRGSVSSEPSSKQMHRPTLWFSPSPSLSLTHPSHIPCLLPISVALSRFRAIRKASKASKASKRVVFLAIFLVHPVS
jgi:hypothetical protein